MEKATEEDVVKATRAYLEGDWARRSYRREDQILGVSRLLNKRDFESDRALILGQLEKHLQDRSGKRIWGIASIPYFFLELLALLNVSDFISSLAGLLRLVFLGLCLFTVVKIHLRNFSKFEVID